MQLAMRSDDGQVVNVAVRGRVLDEETQASDDVLAQLLGENVYARKVLLSMAEAEILNSNGVSWLLNCHKRFEQNGGRLVLHSVPPLVQNVLKVLRMQLVLHVAQSPQDARRLAQEEAP